jgi:hypothetical protein
MEESQGYNIRTKRCIIERYSQDVEFIREEERYNFL